ncbi:MAG TPA: DUF4386 family protein [Roseiflexaceae bacterium]|mgnify:CR=1 FL=1|nr:DUF4386 family protein [Roseiflexaceae bacterium]
MERTTAKLLDHRHVGGVAALYLAAASLAAMPYFLLVLDYPSVADPAAKLALIVAHQADLYVFNLLAYVVFGLVLTVLALVLHDHLTGATPAMARVIVGWGVIWSCLLIANGTIANMGMEYVVNLQVHDATGAVAAWQLIEAIVNGLGGAGGELLGGAWMLMVSMAGLRARRLPGALHWLGLATGIVGLASNIPPLRESAAVFGLLQIVWFIWLGITFLRTGQRVGSV